MKTNIWKIEKHKKTSSNARYNSVGSLHTFSNSTKLLTLCESKSPNKRKLIGEKKEIILRSFTLILATLFTAEFLSRSINV